MSLRLQYDRSGESWIFGLMLRRWYCDDCVSEHGLIAVCFGPFAISLEW